MTGRENKCEQSGAVGKHHETLYPFHAPRMTAATIHRFDSKPEATSVIFERAMTAGNPQQAFETMQRIWGMLSLPLCRERAVVKAQKERAARLVALLEQSIPSDLSQQRARSEIPILAGRLKKFLTPVTHKNYRGGRSAALFVGKSLHHIESVLREKYSPKQNRSDPKQPSAR